LASSPVVETHVRVAADAELAPARKASANTTKKFFTATPELRRFHHGPPFAGGTEAEANLSTTCV
jgi:hypothetical protein